MIHRLYIVPPGVTLILEADDTVERRRGREITAKGYSCDGQVKTDTELSYPGQYLDVIGTDIPQI
jgi:hypothetical protein